MRHSRFVFRSITSAPVGEDLIVKFFYEMDGNDEFSSVFTFHGAAKFLGKDESLISAWLLRIGMVDMLSYWKAALAPIIEIHAGYVSPEEIPFWQTLLQNGMSEFFWVNKIDGWAEDFVQIVCTAPKTQHQVDQQAKKAEIILPIGGGKDSIVALEILKHSAYPLHAFSVNPQPAVEKTFALNPSMDTIGLTRKLDPRLLELNAAGAYNGHTPFSALLAFCSTFTAYLQDIHYVALSNEWSANEANLEFLGHEVNHQYSKSLAFEKNFREYVQKNLSTSIEYFSFLRPLHELQIAKILHSYPRYFPAFISCNVGGRRGIWCGECPKCLFAAIVLAPFFTPDELENIFHKSLLDSMELQPILDELTGITPAKSLECVGTREESRLALAETIRLYTAKNIPLPALLQYADIHILQEHDRDQQRFQTFMRQLQAPNFLPDECMTLLRSVVEKTSTEMTS